MKKKQIEYCIIIFGLVISFIIGRESSSFNNKNYETPFKPNSYQSITPIDINAFNNSLKTEEKNGDIVYQCGKSKIYHPTLSHASFKKCKSKVTKLTVKKAKNIGMRHCKCSN